MKTKHSLVLTLLLMISLAGCGGDTQREAEEHAAKIDEAMSQSASDASGGAAGSMPGGCYLRAVIDGQKWEATEMTPDRSHATIIPVSGKKEGSSITFVIGGMKENIGKPSQLGPANTIIYWSGENIMGAEQGEVTVQKMDEKFVEGTFQFTDNDEGKTVTCTDGEFRIPAPLRDGENQ